ncbi:MAG TPA: hypothetical protein ENJ56_04530, partial [Anaerolineae bacterium]|nr:hypothetical protein [Anaerolineae bacterium]
APWQLPNTEFDVHNGLLSDVVNYIYPVKAFAAESLRAGKFPLWNPYVAGGYPFTYNTQAGLYYPLSLLMVLLPPAQGFDLIIIVQMLLGGWFMFAYLRQLKLDPLAALLGTFVFLFNGMMLVWLEWQVVHAAVIWLPLQLWGIEKIAASQHKNDNNTIWYVLLTGVAIALPWLDGHWNWTLYGSLTVGLYLLWRSWAGGRRLFWAGAKAIGIGMGLAMIQVLPAVVYLAQSHRGAMSWADSAERGLLRHAVVFLIPKFFGTPVAQNWWGGSALNFNEATLYLGILPLFLTLIALRSRHHTHTHFFAIWSGIGLLWTLGTIAYRPLHALPVFSGLFPSRALVIVVFCVSILAAIGLDALLKRELNFRNVTIVAILFALALTGIFVWYYQPQWADLQKEVGIFALFLLLSGLLCGVLAQRLPSTAIGWLAIVIVIADLYLFGYDYNTVSPIAQLYPPTDTAQFLHNDPEPNRIATLASGVVYRPNTSTIDQIENISGYEPGVLARMVNYLDLAEGEPTVRFTRVMLPQLAVNSPLLDALNVKYIVSIDDRWGESQAVAPVGTVAGWRSLPQKVRLPMPDAGLHRVTLPLRGTGTVTVRIVSADQTYEFAHTTAQIDTTSPTPTAFDFGAFPSAWGRDFGAIIEGDPALEIAVDANGQPLATAYFLTRPGLKFENEKVRIYENEGYLPRAYAVHQALFAQDETEALALLAENQTRLAEVVILEGTQKQLAPSDPAAISTVDVVAHELNR